MVATSLLAVLPLVGLAHAHASIWHPSMYGFNVTATNSPQYGSRDNRPQAPLKGLPFDQWWFHGHLDQPPHPNDVMELPAGGKVTTELACDKDATSWWESGPGGNTQNGNDPCPGPPSVLIHTNGIDDLGGCALAIAYKSDVNDVQPEDFVVFSINHQCVWDRYTDFPVPANMPACPNGKCICAWFWQHREDAGGDEMYMNGFQCNVTGATSTTPVAQGQVPVRCVDDSSKCVKGAKQPFYWDQAERNNMFEGIYTPPLYLDTYGFANGAQNDIFETSGAEAKTSATSVVSTSTSMATSSTVNVAATPTSTPAPATSEAATSAAEPTSSSYVPEAATTPATSAPNVANTPSSSTEAPATSTPAPQQVQAADPTTTSPATTTKGGQGHRTCRPKKNKRGLRHRSRRSRAL